MKGIRLLLGIILALAMPAAALAASDPDVLLPKGETQTGTYYAHGTNVTVDGDVSGDVVCAGQAVVINGSVGGDVLCAAQTLTINGPVAGSVRSVGQVLTVNNTVGRNVTVAAQNFTLGNAAKVSGDVAAAGQTIVLSGPVGQAVYLAGSQVKLNSSVAGNVTAYAESLSLGKDAALAADLDYTSANTFSLDKSKVQGDITRHAEPGRSPRDTAGAILAGLLYWLLAGLLGMLLAIWLAPRLVRSVTNAMTKKWQSSLGWGALALLLGPVILIILSFTVVGLPTAAVAGILWFMALMLSGLFAGVAVGRLLWQREDSNRRALALAALVGIPLVLLCGWIPVIGGLVKIAVACWAMGGMLLAANRARALG